MTFANICNILDLEPLVCGVIAVNVSWQGIVIAFYADISYVHRICSILKIESTC